MDKSLKNKKVGILGFGMEGKDLANYLHKQGALITVFDQKTKDELNFQGIDTHEIEFVCGSNYLSGINSDFDIIFRSPGVYRYKEELIKAERNGVAISSAIKLFFEKCPSRIIGVTGTKGKGTTSTLIYNICKEQGLDVYLAGNIGKPYLELLPSLTKQSIVVMEISSFQLIDLHKSPHVAVVLNITSDHLDWHLNQEEYVSAKKNIVLHQNDTDYAVINFDYETPKNFEKLTSAKVFYFSKKNKVNGCYVTGNKIRICMNGGNQIVGDVGDLQLRGRHNWENVTAAVCASFCIGCNIDSIKKSVFKFKGLEHRLEFVSKVNGVSYYNDSFSTNPQPTMAAVDSFSEPVILILGGSDKGLSYSQMASHIAKAKNVKATILIGQIADRIEFELRKSNFKGLIFNLGMTSMQKVVEKAREVSASGDVVLLSPASASFDMFCDYKDRGSQFKNQVYSLVE